MFSKYDNMVLCEKKIKITILLLLITLFASAPIFNTKADLVKDIEKQIKKKSKKIESLKTKEKEYKDMVRNLQTKQQNLKNEVEIFDARIAQFETKINTTETQIEQTNLEINNILIQIQARESEIESQKRTLKSLIREINYHDQKSMLEILLKNEELSDFFNQSEYVNSISEKIKNTLYKLKETKHELEGKKKELENKKVSLENLKKRLYDQKETAKMQKKAKEALLLETKGKEYKFQKLLINIKNQRKTILGDINELKIKMEAEIARISAMSKKPSENLASTSWYFSQNDPKWKNMTIGLSNSTIDDYGCAVASVAMVFKYYGINIDPGILAKQPIYYRDLISWPKRWRFLRLIKNSFHKSGGLSKNDWEMINRQIANGHPVIVFIRAIGKNAGHYVVIHGKDSKDYIVHDPIRWNNQNSANIYLSTTKKYLESLYKTNTIIDQMIIYN